MNGRLMKMELDGNINNKENIGEISEKRLEEIKQEYSNFMQLYTINDYKKIEQLMNENTCVSEICEIMGRNVESVRKVIENIVKTKVNIKSYRQNN